MIFNILISTLTRRGSIDKSPCNRTTRNKYISQKYNERSITNRYFK